ncbi:MAG: TetR/AcrR family transcriptional regulator [Spirochaetaceae bacterium]|jgi:AcrR family transcriptional regulator|nr:TetR/AcrR family transcriptional regulator [Spirochaetaceae bacterium]
MSIVVEHDKRRKDILEKSLDVFVDEGFEDATFQKIADRCGITRTTLYIYFKNKKEIFTYSIKQLLQDVEADITLTEQQKDLHCADKLIKVLSLIVDRLEENQRLLQVILNYLLYLSKSETNPETRVRRRTIRLRHIITGMVLAGIKKGELPPVNVKTLNDLLYGFLECAIFRLSVLHHPSVSQIKENITLAVEALRRN